MESLWSRNGEAIRPRCFLEQRERMLRRVHSRVIDRQQHVKRVQTGLSSRRARHDGEDTRLLVLCS
eukprot:6188178-Pleurochrysis_carterae.AAC.1